MCGNDDDNYDHDRRSFEHHDYPLPARDGAVLSLRPRDERKLPDESVLPLQHNDHGKAVPPNDAASLPVRPCVGW